MYLVFEPTRHGIRYAVFAEEASILYDGFCPISNWSSRTVQDAFTKDLVIKVRGHGRVFTRVGIILPYAPSDYTKPQLASATFIKKIGTTDLLRATLAPTLLLLQQLTKTWPHLTPYFLFDTHLSEKIERYMVVPPFPYDTLKSLAIAPTLIHSYGHRANLAKHKNGFALSLYIGEQVSLALFRGDELQDAHVSYSPASSLMGLQNAGALDPELIVQLVEHKRLPYVTDLLTKKSGLQPMTETTYSLPQLLQIAGVSPRTKDDVTSLPIEAMEWIELSVRSFIRSLRHAIGGLATEDLGVKTLIVNTSIIPADSGLWRLLTQGALNHLKLVTTDTPLIQAACLDLIAVEEAVVS